MEKAYRILKFYAYTTIEDPEATREKHDAFGVKHNLLGRIKVASEGINGTISGLKEDCEAYIAFLKSDPRLANMMLNVEKTRSHTHQKLHVRVKSEIVHAGLPDIQPSLDMEDRCYVKPTELREMLDDPNVVVMDVRSNYEHRLGTFSNAMTFDIKTFRELPEKLEEHKLDKEKTYVLACTFGVKCEKARDYLKKVKKMPHVYHLQGGIANYGQSTDGKGFEGVCYVFDERLSIPISENESVVSHCYHCGVPSYRMINCANPECNMHMPLCETCGDQLEGACTIECQNHPRKRIYDGTGYYVKPGVLRVQMAKKEEK